MVGGVVESLFAGPVVDAEMSDLQAALERSFNLTMQVVTSAHSHVCGRAHCIVPHSCTNGHHCKLARRQSAQGMKAASDIETETANLDRRIRELKGELKK